MAEPDNLLNAVPLRDFIERILTEHDKAHSAQHEAVTIAAKELERRLETLNHAHERSVEDRGRFVQADKYDDRAKEVDRRLSGLERSQVSTEAVAAYRRAVYGALGAALLAIAIAAFSALTHR